MGLISYKTPNVQDHVKKNPTGKLFMNDVGSAGPGYDCGKLGSGLSKKISPSSETEIDYSESTRGTLLTTIKETANEGTLVLREWSKPNVLMAVMGSAFVAANQVVGSLDSVSTAFTIYKYIDLGKMNVYSTKVLHGAEAVANFQIDETVTATSGGTGVIKWRVADTYVELITVTGTIAVGDTITGGTSGTTAVVSSVQTLNDVIVCDADPGTVRYVNGTHYSLNYEHGFLRIDHATPVSPVFVSAQYLALGIEYVHGMNVTSIERKLTLISNAGDIGPQFMLEMWKVALVPNVEMILVGDGLAPLTFGYTVLQDDTQPTGQKYEKWTFYE